MRGIRQFCQTKGLTMQITINIRDVYGERKAYPFDQNARHFAAIAGTKTLTNHTLCRALELGFDVVAFRDGVPAFTVKANERGFSDPGSDLAIVA